MRVAVPTRAIVVLCHGCLQLRFGRPTASQAGDFVQLTRQQRPSENRRRVRDDSVDQSARVGRVEPRERWSAMLSSAVRQCLNSHQTCGWLVVSKRSFAAVRAPPPISISRRFRRGVPPFRCAWHHSIADSARGSVFKSAAQVSQTHAPRAREIGRRLNALCARKGLGSPWSGSCVDRAAMTSRTCSRRRTAPHETRHTKAR
jgi:hypothetical protein